MPKYWLITVKVNTAWICTVATKLSPAQFLIEYDKTSCSARFQIAWACEITEQEYRAMACHRTQPACLHPLEPLEKPNG